MNSDNCKTPGCWNPRPRQHHGRGFHHYCWKCQTRKKKEKDPVARELARLKSSASRRGIPCKLTIEEFRWWCKQTDYIELKGRGKGKKSIGRIDHSKGYTLSNIRLEDFHWNSIKGADAQDEHSPQNHSYRSEEDPF